MNIEPVVLAIRKAYPWLVIWSVVVFVCGLLAIILPVTFSFGIAVIIGSLVFIAGSAHFVFAFQTRNVGGFLWQILLCALYLMGAICLLANPLLGVLSVTLILSIFLLLEGILEFFLYFRLRRFRHSLWILIDGVGTLILGILMIRQWPPADPEVIGTLIGISLMLSAVSRIMLFVALRDLNPARA